MLQTEILTELITFLESELGLFAPIYVNRLGKDGGISAEITSGRNSECFLNRSALQVMSVLFLAKSASQEEAMNALFDICNLCGSYSSLPTGINNIEVSSTPSFVDRENTDYIYSALINISYIVGA